ncbi:MAG: hypothetical protein WBF33_38965, partial [Candidatus Nitrosopolaris sp.]
AVVYSEMSSMVQSCEIPLLLKPLDVKTAGDDSSTLTDDVNNKSVGKNSPSANSSCYEYLRL